MSDLHISRRMAEPFRAVSLGERIGSSEFGWALEAPVSCRGCLNFLSVDFSGREVECSGDPSERSPRSEECMAYVPLDVVRPIARSRELGEVSRKAAVDIRRPIHRTSIHRRLSAAKEYGCRVCGLELTEENWYSSHRRRGNEGFE